MSNYNIPWVLYQTVGQEFEKYLTPNDLEVMSKTSSLTRGGVLSEEYRKIRDYLLDQEDEKLKELPLRTIALELNTTMGKIYDIAEYLWHSRKISTWVIILMMIENHRSNDLDKIITDIIHLEASDNKEDLISKGYDEELLEVIKNIKDRKNLSRDFSSRLYQWLAIRSTERNNPTLFLTYIKKVSNFFQSVYNVLLESYPVISGIRKVLLENYGTVIRPILKNNIYLSKNTIKAIGYKDLDQYILFVKEMYRNESTDLILEMFEGHKRVPGNLVTIYDSSK